MQNPPLRQILNSNSFSLVPFLQYVHIDFANSGGRAFNLLVNLQTPGDDPELTVIEEDDLGNRRRGQIKYAPDFGVLNGDDAMHATNE